MGHSTRSREELSALLQQAHVQELVDVRSAPSSRRHPHFAAKALAASLRDCGIAYVHEPHLGGYRRARPDSPNRGWSHPAFVGYADHMTTSEFEQALERVRDRARDHNVCLMCAEAQWWRCHRRLIADALLARGWTVLHLGLGGAEAVHELTSFAVLGPGGGLTYPPVQAELSIEDV